MKKVKAVLPILIIVNLLCMMDVSIMTIVLPEIQTAFKTNLNNLSWALNVYTIIFASMIIPFGRLSDKLGKNKFIFTGLIIFGIGSLLTGLSPNLSFMLVARAIQSLGAAMIIPTSMVTAMELTDDQNRNKTIGILAGSQGLAVALGPAIGGFVSQFFGWRWVFFINVPVIIIVLIIFNLVLPVKNEKIQKSVNIDWLGTILSIILLASFSLALIEGKDWGWLSAKIISLLIIALVALITFVVVESKVTNPMINLNLFRDRNFTGSAISLVLCNYLLGGFAVIIPTFLTKIYNHSELSAALLITPYSIAVMFSVIFSSLAIKKLNQKLMLAIGFILMGFAYYQLSNLNLDHSSLPLVYAGITLGIGYGIVASTANILAASNFHGQLLTDSNSVANVLRQVGMVLAIAIFASLLTNNIKTAKTNLINDGQQQITNLKVPGTVKQKLNHTIKQKLDPNSNQVSQNKASSNKTADTIPVTKIQMIEERNYQIAVKQIAATKGVSPNSLPEPVKNQIKAQVNQTVESKINAESEEIKNFINHFQKTIKRQLKVAFLKVYRSMIWMPFLSLLVIPVFTFKKRK
ncbi:MFS transporter [Fructilactobacillus carniphilus]|uniref:MFS transporter n=1 Tax=Fructilactobacillus carniphilus TaxID=2940297 RepID=A0ABY5BYS4_9LACO|nr:DHA2 family efflux MFS transporter permease subunit [Fructilactobacillus carniphilus]USS91088.1 MFS transporter [Fructilactobacillus carniphilus]